MADTSHATWLEQARSHLRACDPVLARLIDERPDFDPRAWIAQLLPPLDLYGALMWQIIGQQLPVASARSIAARIEALCDGLLPTPAQLLDTEPAKLRAAGLSWRKIGTLRDLAQRLSDGRLDQDALRTRPDDELMAELTAIPGIGPWTVQGALILAFQREDVVLPAISRCERPSRPSTSWITCPASRRCRISRRNGGHTAPWRPFTCIPPSSARPRIPGFRGRKEKA